MYMIGHQHVGVDGAAKFGSKLVQVMQVELVIFLGIKAYRAVIAALDDVPRDAGNGETRATWHGVSAAVQEDCMLPEIENRGLSPIIRLTYCT